MTPTADLAIVDLRSEIKLYIELQKDTQKSYNRFKDKIEFNYEIKMEGYYKGKTTIYTLVIKRLTSLLQRLESNYDNEKNDE